MIQSITNKCRICGAQTIPYFDYGAMPLVNQLFDSREAAINATRYPLSLDRCPECVNSQLPVVVDPEILYANYPYRSSVSQPFRDHCQKLAEKIALEVSLTRKANRMMRVESNQTETILDIGGNDGTLLRAITSIVPGIKCVIVDPSQSALTDATFPVEKVCSFWSSQTAREFVANYGKAKVITAQNVVAHVDDVHDFFEGVSLALADDGRFVVEVPHVLRMLLDCEFDTVYHEHLSYMSLEALEYLAHRHDLAMIGAESIEQIHCGTIRVWFAKYGRVGINPMKRNEHQLYADTIYRTFAKRTLERVNSVKQVIADFRGRAIGITASAKGNILLNMIDSGLEYLVDNTPAKIGKFVPGTGLEVKDFCRENVEHANFALILSRNFKDALIEKLRMMNFTGEVFVP